jgi:hypothetical protein
VSTQSQPRSVPTETRLRSQSATLEAARLVDEALRKWVRRGAVVLAVGVALFGGFVLAARYFNETKNAVNRNGQEAKGRVTEKSPLDSKPGERWVIVEYPQDKGMTTVKVFLPERATVAYEVGQKVKLSVDRDSKVRTIIVGATPQERVTSMPVAGLLVSSFLVMGMGLFDLQAAARCRKYLKGQTWRSLRWRGVVYGPGRGRVRAAGWLTDPDADRHYLMVNALGCWRQGIDLLSEPTEVSVAGNPVGIVVVRHPATLRVVLLRPPRGERQRAKALTLLAADVV